MFFSVYVIYSFLYMLIFFIYSLNVLFCICHIFFSVYAHFLHIFFKCSFLYMSYILFCICSLSSYVLFFKCSFSSYVFFSFYVHFLLHMFIFFFQYSVTFADLQFFFAH